MSVPKTEGIAEYQDITKEEFDTICNRNLQDKGTENPFEKNYKPCPRDEENFRVNAPIAEVPLNSYNNATIYDVTLLPESGTAARFSPFWKQVITVSPSILLAFESGLTMGYTSILTQQLRSEDKFLRPYNALFWIAMMAYLPLGLGCLISGLIMEMLGRRTSQGIICVPLLLGWILIASGINIPILMIGRFITGLCIGLSSPLSSVYIAETTEPRFRGFFISGLLAAQSLGILAINTLGTFLTWQWAACTCCIFPTMALGIVFLIPESPTWLIAKRRVEEGVKAYGWLRGHSDKANAELREILEKQKEVDSEPPMGWLEKLRMLIGRKLLKPLIIMTFFFIVSNLSGLNDAWYLGFVYINQELGPSVDVSSTDQILNISIVIISAIACVVSQLCGRRLVTVFSGVFTALSLIGLCVLVRLREGMYMGTSWLIILCLLVYTCANCIGLMPLPWVICGEIFPVRVRGLGSSLSTAAYFIISFIETNMFVFIKDRIGIYVFLIYGVLTLAGTVVLYFILPETRGKSLQEIEEEFQKK